MMMPKHPTQTQPSGPVKKVGLETLPPEHFEVLQRSLSRILSTGLALETFAQIVDGRPTRDVYQDYYNAFRSAFHDNLRPSDAALEAAESHRRNFLTIGFLEIDTNVAQSYQNTSIGSREFNLRLIEILAILCHSIAVRLYDAYDGGFHKPEPVQQTPRELLCPDIKVPELKPPPTELFHTSYEFWEQYPHGVADIVGYWAEYRLFGGVVLFDRGETGSELAAYQCKDIFIHPVGRYMVFQLSDSQVQAYVNFLLSEQPFEGLRFEAEQYARRIDPYDSMGLNIYRDRYERKIPEIRPVRCVVRGEDMPGYKEALEDFSRRTRTRRK